jgi:glycosyltransferase involved in cell wall biosynthesis
VGTSPVGHAELAIVHDYLTTMGGAERVVVSMTRAFPGAPVFTALYEPASVTPELADGLDVRASPLNRFGLFRHNHRAAMPLLGATFARTRIDAEVVLCSSSGWAHGVSTPGRKVVYCYNPPRWVYQRREYAPLTKPLWWALAAGMHPYLLRWDRRAAASCERYVAISSIVAERIRRAYGREAEILPPPSTFDPCGPQHTINGLEPGFFLSVGRLIGHKNLAAVVAAFTELPELQLIVVGEGPERQRLGAVAPRNVRFTGRVDDDELRWLYAHCAGIVSASREDFGLTPLEAAAFGKPSVLLRWGGFLDTMIDGQTATFFDVAAPAAIVPAVRRAATEGWDEQAIMENAQRFSEPRFEERLRAIVAEELGELR